MSEKVVSSDATEYSETNAEAIEKALYCLKHGELESVESWLDLLRDRIGPKPAAAPLDEPGELEQVIACLGDDAATLRDADQFIEMADNMDAAARLLSAREPIRACELAAFDKRRAVVLTDDQIIDEIGRAAGYEWPTGYRPQRDESTGYFFTYGELADLIRALHTPSPVEQSASASLDKRVYDLPPLPWPARPHGSTDYFSTGQMRDYASAAIAQALGLPDRTTDEVEVRAVPPRWYSRDEIFHALRLMNYCDSIAGELADWFVRHLQLAFNKGFEKGACAPRPGAYMDASSFQARVLPWMLECFGVEISADRAERNHRFLEEALELVQACGCTASEAHQLVDYTFGRPAGEPTQEVGGVMLTLAALCLANSLDMHEDGEIELRRVWKRVEQIRAKQAAKPKHSPLPIALQSGEVHTDDLAVDRFSAELKDKLRVSREKGRGGWEETDPTELSVMLREHVEKGDPRDVANYCVFLWNLGKPITDAALPMGRRAVPADELIADIQTRSPDRRSA